MYRKTYCTLCFFTRAMHRHARCCFGPTKPLIDYIQFQKNRSDHGKHIINTIKYQLYVPTVHLQEILMTYSVPFKTRLNMLSNNLH